jgi:hypothetical protein
MAELAGAGTSDISYFTDLSITDKHRLDNKTILGFYILALGALDPIKPSS